MDVFGPVFTSYPELISTAQSVDLSCTAWMCLELRTPLCEPGTKVRCSQVEEPNLSQQGSKRLCIDSHSPGNDCHTSAKSQPPTGANHIKRGCQGAPLVNRGNKHLLILTYSSAADTHRCALSHCLH
ncbi:hypothetical protein PAMP_024610 [Pampus punctatissimus]